MKSARDELKFKTIRISAKGQIAIPSDMRREMNIRKGEELLLIKKGGQLLIEKSSKASRKFVGEFNFMLKNAEHVAKRLWENKEDEIWNNV